MNNLIVIQEAIAVTGTAQNLPNNPVNKSVTIHILTGGATVYFGNSAAVTDSTGFALEPGDSVEVPLAGGNTNQLWATGTSGSSFSVIGA